MKGGNGNVLFDPRASSGIMGGERHNLTMKIKGHGDRSLGPDMILGRSSCPRGPKSISVA